MPVKLIRAYDGRPAGAVYASTPEIEEDLVRNANATLTMEAVTDLPMVELVEAVEVIAAPEVVVPVASVDEAAVEEQSPA